MSQKIIINKSLKNRIYDFQAYLKDVENLGSIVFLIILVPSYLIYINRSFDPGVVVNIVISGLLQGAFYSLIAVGFAIIFGIAKMFKLSIGGYFVLGSYAAFWLNKVIYVPINEINNTGITDFTSFLFKSIIYIPILLFFIFLIIYIRIWGKKYGGFIVILNLLLLVVQRGLMVSNYNAVNLEATVLAIVILDGILAAGLALVYLELSKKQIITSILLLNLITTLLNTNNSFPSSPAIYVSIFLLSVIFASIIAIFVDRYILEKARVNQTNVLIITFGIALLIQSVIPIFTYPENGEFIEFGIDPKNLEGIVQKFDNYIIFGQPFQSIRVIAAVLAVILLVIIFLFIKKTPMGKAMEAVSEDPEAAWLVGINVRKVYLISAGLGMGLSAAAGVLTSPVNYSPSWSVYMGWTPLVFAIAVVTLGGIGSIFGSAIAGFIVGFTESTIAQTNPKLAKIVPLIVIFLIILIRPNGLFGVKEEDE
ncbi:MAG: branched-chain amino acid ABC transporter permease [Candidatus Heimdallarchaeota archaeon]|nr:branched-chain amino acid ABC transporter permease [Candidatus Heimdallarchaeota archaeon]